MPTYEPLPVAIESIVDQFLSDGSRFHTVDKAYMVFFKDGLQDQYMKLVNEKKTGQPADILMELLRVYRAEMDTREPSDDGATAMIDMIQIMERWLSKGEGVEMSMGARK